MSRQTKMPSAVKLLALTAVTVFVWIVFDVVHTLRTEPPPVVDAKVLEPLTPALDAITLDKLQNRVFIEDSEIPDTVLRNPDDSEPQPTPSPESSPVVSENQPQDSSPSATESEEEGT